jgi:inorganic pyrophosphatase
MLSTMATALTIDAFGPISDNAGGIAEMCLSESFGDTRKVTDKLDAAGNTTAAIGKGFAIGSAALVSLALISAFVTRVNSVDASLLSNINLLDPLVFSGLLVGALLPYWFSGMTNNPSNTNGSNRFIFDNKLASTEFTLVTNALINANDTNAALPIANPFPIAAVVLPAASNLSVTFLVSPNDSDKHISAIPPALSLIGPNASIVNAVAIVLNIPNAAIAIP